MSHFFKGVQKLVAGFLALIMLTQPLSAFGNDIGNVNYQKIFTPDSFAQYAGGNVSTKSGAYSYIKDFQIPRGVNDHTPDFALTYNSQDITPSMYGAGWSDNIPFVSINNKRGLDSVYASTSQDFFSSLHGDLTDLGQGNFQPKYQQNGIHDYSQDSNGWGYDTSNGLKYIFGDTTLTQEYDPNNVTRVSKWLVSEIIDRYGNSIKYSYIRDGNKLYVSSITYGYSDVAQTQSRYEIAFTYGNQNNPTTLYSNGYEQILNKQIESISIKNNGTEITTYDFTFKSQATSTPILLVDEIVQISQKGTAQERSLPPLTMEYRSGDTQYTRETSYVDGPNLSPFNNIELTTAEINGDGLVDFVYNEHGNYGGGVFLNTGNLSWLKVKDIDETGLDDIDDISFENGVMIDLNGDGLDDFFHFAYGTQADGLWLGNGDGTFTFKGGLGAIGILNYPGSNYIPGRHPFIDVNGDGLLDLLTDYVYLNKGDGLWEKQLNMPYSGTGLPANVSKDDYVFTDLNRDGLTDFMYYKSGSNTSNNIWLNQGDGTWAVEKSYLSSGLSLKPNYYRFGDYNGDGLLDAMLQGGGVTGGLYIGDGNLHWTHVGSLENLGLPGYSPVTPNGSMFIDVDGDMVVDFLHRDNSGAANTGIWINSASRNTIENIETSEGASESMTYESAAIHDSSNSSRNSLEVVTEKIIDDGLGNTTEKEYRYKNADFFFKDSFNRTFAGFETIVEIDSLGDKVIETHYHQGNNDNSLYGEQNDSEQKIGLPYLITRADVTGDIGALTYNHYSVASSTAGALYTSIGRVVSEEFEIGTTKSKTKAVEYEYDNTHGQILVQGNLGEVEYNKTTNVISDIGSDSRSRVTEYATGTDIYLISRSALLDHNGNVVEDTQLYYDGLSLGQVSTGKITKKSKWLDTDSSWLDTSYELNDFGLMTSVVNPNNATTTQVYDSSKLFVSGITNSLGHTANQEYDFDIGNISEITDPNGTNTESIFDGFGRVIEKKQTTPSGSEVTIESHTYDDLVMPREITSTRYLTSVPQYTHTFLDGLGRVIQSKQSTSNGDYQVQTQTYDSSGRLKTETLPYTSLSNSYESNTPSSAVTYTHQYDVLDRVTSKQGPMGIDSKSYEAWSATETNKRGYDTEYEYDAHGNIIEVIEEMSSTQAEADAEVEAHEYKKALTITGRSNPIEGYQMLIKVGLDASVSGSDVHLEGNSQYFPQTRNDGGDLAFYDDTETNMLPFWVEKVENDLAYIWVQLEDSLQVDQTIYLYYGHVDPTNFSDGESTFELFDEFSGWELNKTNGA